MFKLISYPKYINPHDNYDSSVGQKQMEDDMERQYQIGFKPCGITSTGYFWEVLYGPKNCD